MGYLLCARLCAAISIIKAHDLFCRLGALVHKKTATAVVLTQVKK